MGVVFAYGFRPFFLVAGAHAALAMAVWVAWLAPAAWGADGPNLPTAFPPPLWHGHEMLFGFAPAVIAGFLLTASANWAGTSPVRGRRLAFLVALWLAGRLALWIGAPLPGVAVAAIDLAFLPALAATVAAPLWRAESPRNLVFIPILAVLAAANLLVHLEPLGLAEGTASTGLVLGLDMIILLMAVVGGRLTPLFTANALKAAGDPAMVRSPAPLAGLAVASVGAVLLVDLAAPESALAPWVVAAAAALQLARMSGWRTSRTLTSPILWVLHLGYAWIALGLACKAAAGFWEAFPESAALHALTAGAVGTYTLGMMSRIALGHTGRPLAVRPAIAVAYAMISAAALLRVASPVLAPGLFVEASVVSGCLWAGAFAVFVAIYWPILTRPRADGRPG